MTVRVVFLALIVIAIPAFHIIAGETIRQWVHNKRWKKKK